MLLLLNAVFFALLPSTLVVMGFCTTGSKNIKQSKTFRTTRESNNDRVHNAVPSLYATTRREILALTGITTMMSNQLISPTIALAVDDVIKLGSSQGQQPSSVSENGRLLESRVRDNALNPPPYGMEDTDIYYPSWFAGKWNVRSETKSVEAPCGIPLFGGNTTYDIAMKDVGNVLKYQSRFLSSQNNKVVADREYNVRSISKVTLGENAIVDVPKATPNQFSCIVMPEKAPSMLKADLIVLNRKQEITSDNTFDCSEVVREIVVPLDQPRQTASPILKEIETISIYTYIPELNEVHCTQRSAVFLIPSNQNAMAMKMWQASRGRAIDVRFYDVVYTK